eukprot:CAMPEP_0184663386 /NCGR_PEP_ID=MMETSP0308-20130426/47947_1 /TAXON_ID=38269 /ORGANISM="Gloeochaete witrockiana, Strain SAG 46.84" /LENGTH=395 /DNA_ID=CAMNT_0027106095 /DNA_START=184 /DNA_END=1371 /DNA_ORIENTATION=-
MSTAILNKAVFQFAEFHYPLVLSAIHLLIQSIFTGVYVRVLGKVQRKSLNTKEQGVIAFFALLFCLNIILGNSALRYVSVSFSRTIRSTIPIVTMILSYFILRKKYNIKTQVAFVPLMLGVFLATYGEVGLSKLGFFISVISVFFAALKAVLSNKYLTGNYKLHPLDLLDRTASLAFLSLIPFVFLFGEASRFQEEVFTVSGNRWLLILSSAFAALALNYTSFKLSQITSALAVTVAGNAKEGATIILSVIIFRNPISLTNLLGMVLVLISSAIYSYMTRPKGKVPAPKGTTADTLSVPLVAKALLLDVNGKDSPSSNGSMSPRITDHNDVESGREPSYGERGGNEALLLKTDSPARSLVGSLSRYILQPVAYLNVSGPTHRLNQGGHSPKAARR